MSKLREAAIAVYERWDSPLWKDLPHTGEYIATLRNALDESDRLEMEYTAATLRINNDLLVIAELTAERDEYAKCADDMAAAHKVERDALKAACDKFSEAEMLQSNSNVALQSAARLALDALSLMADEINVALLLGVDSPFEQNTTLTARKAISALKAVL